MKLPRRLTIVSLLLSGITLFAGERSRAAKYAQRTTRRNLDGRVADQREERHKDRARRSQSERLFYVRFKRSFLDPYYTCLPSQVRQP
jgi:hypothetical protein